MNKLKEKPSSIAPRKHNFVEKSKDGSSLDKHSLRLQSLGQQDAITKPTATTTKAHNKEGVGKDQETRGPETIVGQDLTSDVALDNIEEDPAKVKRNENGGVFVSHDDVLDAFKVLDSEGMGHITISNLKKKFGVFFPDMTSKEYRFLMNNNREMTADDLYDLVKDNSIEDFDPVAEAFKLYDQNDEGTIDPERLREIFKIYGMTDIADEDISLLVKTADIDGDGKISLEDFRIMLEGDVEALSQHHMQHAFLKAKQSLDATSK